MKYISKIICIIILLFFLFLGFYLFLQGKTIEISSFPAMSEHYFVNNFHVYYGVQPRKGCDDCDIKIQKISEADPKTIKILNRVYLTDKNNAYICAWTGPDVFRFWTKCEKMENTDHNTFENIVSNSPFSVSGATGYIDVDIDYYAKDKNYVYYYGRIIENADPMTFYIINNDFAFDKNRIYYRDNYYRLCIYGETPKNFNTKKYISENKNLKDLDALNIKPILKAFIELYNTQK